MSKDHLPAELANVKWDGIRPVTTEVAREVLTAFISEQRINLVDLPPDRPKFTMDRKDVRFLSDRAIVPLVLIAQCYSLQDVASIGRTSHQEIERLLARMGKIFGVSIFTLQTLGRAHTPEELPEVIRSWCGSPHLRRRPKKGCRYQPKGGAA